MKIAVLPSSYLPLVGGRQVFAHNISRQLSLMGHDVDVYIPIKSYNNLQPRFRELCVPLPRFYYGLIAKLPSIGLIRAQRHLKMLQQKENYDAWLVVASYPSGYAASCLKKIVPIVLRASGDDIQKSQDLEYGLRLNHSYETAIQHTVQSFDKVVAMTQEARREFLTLGVTNDAIVNIPNGIDLEWFDQKQSIYEIRTKLGWPIDEQIILTTGRNHPKKGFNLIPSIADKLRDKGFRFKWFVVGMGTDQLLQEVKNRQLDEYVLTENEIGVSVNTQNEWRFPHQKLVNMYQASDVYAFPTLLENFPMVMLEAMASATVFVSTNAPGCGELIQHDKNGLLAPMKDADGFAQQLCRVLSEPELRTRLVQNALAFVEEYSWEKVAEQYVNLFKDLRMNKTKPI